jgi:hypothetical protein
MTAAARNILMHTLPGCLVGGDGFEPPTLSV